MIINKLKITSYILCLLCCSCVFKNHEQHSKHKWSYIHNSTLKEQAEDFPDTTYQINNFLLKTIKKKNRNLKIDSSGNRTEYIYNSVSYFELINIETDSVYTFKVNNNDTVLVNKKLYLSTDKPLGFDILQFREINNKIESNGFAIKSKEDKINNMYHIKLSNETYKMTLQIDNKIKSPFNISINNENNVYISGAIIKLQNNTIDNKVFEDWFNYIPHVPEEKVHFFNRLINLLNCTYSK